VTGRAKAFCGVVGISVLATVSVFNPLSTNLDYIYKSELAEQIEKLNKQGDRPLWVCYESSFGSYSGVLVGTLGGRTVSGLQWPPALDFWHALDPERRFERYYNSFNFVYLDYTQDGTVSVSISQDLVIKLTISPDNPVLKAMGARYILAMGDASQSIDRNKFPLIYASRTGAFSIFEIP
jgi:hypothetical protein